MSPASKSVAKHAVRIIAGQYRRRLLPVVAADGLRPTPDRVRQTVFNWLEHQLGGHWAGVHALDLFAGTGALGLEAASRGAASVLLCEQNPTAARQLQASVALLGASACTVRPRDALAVLNGLPSSAVNLLFLDPPFGAGWLEKLSTPCQRVLADGALVYIESESPLLVPHLVPHLVPLLMPPVNTGLWGNFALLRTVKAGAVHASLLKYERL